jgi:biotin operon repressor
MEVTMSKQTAVEYLVEQLESIGFSINDLADYYNEVQIALEMEKEQIEEAFVVHYTGTAEQYYNENYGGNNE